MHRTAKLTRWLTAAAAAVLLVCVSAAYAQTEGYDPMKQITSQWLRPNIQLIIDVSGSMAYDINGYNVGVDITGSWPTATWTRTSTINSANGCTSDGHGGYVAPCLKWTYRLRVSQTYPSRIAVLKNALGNSVTIITQWFPPGYTDATPQGVWTITSANWKVTGASVTGPTLTTTEGAPTLLDYVWNVTFSSKQNDPLQPFDASGINNSNSPPTLGFGSASWPPADLIGKAANTVNFGLQTFSGNNTTCTTGNQVVEINPNDTGVVTNIENAMRLHSASGLDVGGGTPTRGALQAAKGFLTTVFNKDPKNSCGRTYATVLVTDGLSNTCNRDGKSGDGGVWLYPCPGAPPYECGSGSSSGYDCDKRSGKLRDYPDFPAGKAEELYNLNLHVSGKPTQKVRTWVIGVSGEVSPCELNFTAYMGRTDSSAPVGDAGFSLADDPYLPKVDADESKYSVVSDPDPAKNHPSYAYFATTSAALKDAFADILAALGVGDYTTSAPSVSASPTEASTSVGFITSSSYPSWQGHIYAYDLTHPTGTTDPYGFPLLWDAGQTLSKGTFDVTGDSVPDLNDGFTRNIWTWDLKGSIKETQITDSSAVTANKLDNLCGSCGITQAVLDFLRGYDGTLTNTWRPWLLGAIINSTPAVTGTPEIWQTGLLQNHATFEQKYANRHNLMWVGTSDGMVHAFDMVDGAEILALIPPDLLAKQVQLYNTYVIQKAKAAKSAPVGQPKDPAQHIYGVANSMRIADIWNSGSNKYRTVLFITEGPGGTGIHALDITAPYPGRTNVPYKVWKHSPPTDDNDYTVGHKTFPADDTTSATSPFTALWGITANGAANTDKVAELGQTWSVPALGASSATTWELVVGAGWDPTKLTSGTPVVMRITPLTGAVTKYTTLTNEASGTYVHNQTFADDGILQTNSQFFHPDNLVDLGVQLDLHGHLWLLDKGGSPAWKPAALTDSGSVIKGQPLYYAAALAPYPATAATHDVFAFSSGTFYEKSSTVTGPNVGTTGNFMPAIIIATRKLSDKTISIKKSYLKDMLYKSANIGARSQVTQYPLLLMPKPGTTGKAIALYMVYDPTAGACVGTSYALRATFDPADLSTATFSLDLAGYGASAGFAVDPQGGIHPSQSFVGEGGRAYFPAKLDLPSLPPAGGLGGAVIWWAELQ